MVKYTPTPEQDAACRSYGYNIVDVGTIIVETFCGSDATCDDG